MTDVAPGLSASQPLFAPDQTGAAKLGGQMPQTAARIQPTVVASAKKKPEEHGLGPLLRHLFSARAGNSYSN
jgi:hypothetical protein